MQYDAKKSNFLNKIAATKLPQKIAHEVRVLSLLEIILNLKPSPSKQLREQLLGKGNTDLPEICLLVTGSTHIPVIQIVTDCKVPTSRTSYSLVGI